MSILRGDPKRFLDSFPPSFRSPYINIYGRERMAREGIKKILGDHRRGTSGMALKEVYLKFPIAIIRNGSFTEGMRKKAMHRKNLEQDTQVHSEIIYQGHIVSLQRDQLFVGKKPKKYDIVLHPGAVVIIPIHEKGNLILVKQWRHAVKQILIEFPAGTLEHKEDPQACADRELQEEIGYKAKKLLSIGGFFTSPGFCTEYIHLFLAQDLKPSRLIGEDLDEIIESLSLPLKEGLRMIEEGLIIDAKTILGMYYYKNWLTKQKMS